MQGVIWHIYCNQQKGMIRGDDGAGTFPKIGFELNGVSHAFFGPERQLPRHTSISLPWTERTSGRFRLGKRWNTANTLGTSVCGLPGSRSYRIPEVNPHVGVELPFAGRFPGP